MCEFFSNLQYFLVSGRTSLAKRQNFWNRPIKLVVSLVWIQVKLFKIVEIFLIFEHRLICLLLNLFILFEIMNIAGIGFDSLKPENRLASSDAEYVQIIHTDGNKFGMIQPIGHGNLKWLEFIFSHNYYIFSLL